MRSVGEFYRTIDRTFTPRRVSKATYHHDRTSMWLAAAALATYNLASTRLTTPAGRRK
jgi:hypothetical protein